MSAQDPIITRADQILNAIFDAINNRINVGLASGDIELGAVEIKDSNIDARASVSSDGGLYTKDAGIAQATSLGVAGVAVTSANANAVPLVITDAPTSGQKIVLDDLEISVDTAMLVTIRTTTSNQVYGRYYMAANSTIQLTTRGKKKVLSANQTLEAYASVAGNIAVTAVYHSEA